MRITKIEQQKKDNSRYNIYIDGEFSFGLYDDTLLKYGLRSGDLLDEQKCTEIREYDEYNFGKKVAYGYLSYKQRSKKEIEKKLAGKKISKLVIERIMDWLTELKYVNDDAYAKMLVEDKIRKKPMGKRLIEQKLKIAGLGKESIEKALKENYTPDVELEKARLLLDKYIKKGRFKSEFDKKGKSYKYLISRGFSGDIIEAALIKMHEKAE